MKSSHAFLFLVIFYLLDLVQISVEYSYELESKFLYMLDKGCKNIDIRFDAGYFEKLQSCRIVHGFLRISDIYLESTDYNSTEFAELREITGYFLITNVSGIQSLSQLFPNLQAIRGEILHHGFALVITTANDLENIGLKSLTFIANGNVLIENNDKLSYVETVNWTLLRKDLKVINKNNSDVRISCEMSDHCWSNEIPQKICENCDHCLMSDDDDDDQCTICNKFILPNEDEEKCTIYKPLTFELENRYLVNAEMCDELGRTRLDDKCLKIDECPMEENHFYNVTENACLYSRNGTQNCTVDIKSIEDLRDFTDINCNIAKEFSITGLQESMDEDVQKLIHEKFSNLVEIEACLMIENSSAITNLNFLRKLRKIGECHEIVANVSVVITDNGNLHTFIPNKFNITIRTAAKVIVKRNKNLCDNELEKVKFLFKDSKDIDVPMDECSYGKLTIDVLVTENSALVMLDGTKIDGYQFQLIYWKGGSNFTYMLESMHYEITNLEPDRRYPLKVKIIDKNEKEIYSSSFHFIDTPSTSDFIINANLSSDRNSINITINELRLFDDNDYEFYVSYTNASRDTCSGQMGLKNNRFNQDNRPFDRYFLTRLYFEESLIFPIDSKQISIIELDPLTCYSITIIACVKRSQKFCYMPMAALKETKDVPIPITPFAGTTDIELFSETTKSSNILSSVITIAIVFVTVPILLFYSYKIYTKRKAAQEEQEAEIELQRRVDKYEINRASIETTKVIGKGEFGVVFLGFIRSDANKFYAIKTLAESKDNFEESFIKEAQMMKKFDAHHVVKLIGYCTKEKPLMVVMELMVHGDLKKFLHRNRPMDTKETINQASTSAYTVAPTSIKPLHNIRSVAEMAVEIADGMMYLENMKFIHCDLACRNCMVHETYTIKIGDFGMARELYYSDYYKPGSRNKRIPLRWMSPEALSNVPRYTSKSDVFSFGVVLYELVTYCEKPYSPYSDEQVVQMIKTGITMEKPKDCDEKIYQLMLSCWRYDSNDRISFKEIIEFLLNNYDIANFNTVSFYHNEK